MSERNYKILNLLAENLKRLEVVDITPRGAMVEICGRNGSGKSSTLDAIWWAIEGAKHIQSAPIRKGATEARIRLDLGELIVQRTFKAKDGGGFTTSISVMSAEGAKFDKPQSILDALVGELTFDPLAFTRMKPEDQFDTLKQFVPGVDFVQIAGLNKRDYDERTDVNRQAKALRAQAAAIIVPATVPDVVDESALVAELEGAGQFNTELEQRRTRRANAAREAATAAETAKRDRERAAELRAQAAAMDAQAEQQEAHAADLQKKVDEAAPLPAPKDTAAIRQRIETARATNADAASAERRNKLQSEADALEAKSKALTESIEARDTAKAKAIAEAKMPVDGVGFGDGIVTLNGVPFDQGSDAEQLRASIAIAAALSPALRVIRVRDGSLLDDDAMALLADFAERADMQVWIERVASASKMGFVLEAGRVKSEPEAETEEEVL